MPTNPVGILFLEAASVLTKQGQNCFSLNITQKIAESFR